MLRLTEGTSRPTVLASAVLALALLGDSLLYAVLPLQGTTFGLSLPWVGVLLSANRVTRLFGYPLLARIGERSGLRRLTIGAAAIAACSTLWFGVAEGPWPLLPARIAWGMAFGALSLTTLAYATANAERAGMRVGLSLSLRELGPLASLLFGTLLAASIGTRLALVIVGLVSLLAIPLAVLLPPDTTASIHREPPQSRGSRQWSRDLIASSAMGFVADGMFPATIALVLAPAASTGAAAAAAGAVLALKRAAVVVLSPVSGRAADRFGALGTTKIGFAVTAAGAALIASARSIGGALLLICGAAMASAAMPLLRHRENPRARLPRLAALGLARDAGAAAGPLVALAVFERTGGPLLYLLATVVLAAATCWMQCGDGRPVRRGVPVNGIPTAFDATGRDPERA